MEFLFIETFVLNLYNFNTAENANIAILLELHSERNVNISKRPSFKHFETPYFFPNDFSGKLF